jgi:hypothetical protein
MEQKIKKTEKNIWKREKPNNNIFEDINSECVNNEVIAIG